MAQRTCTLPNCDRPYAAKGMCKPCYRRDYYKRHREHELATMAAWRERNYDYDRQRFAAYAQRRWGAERTARAAARAAEIAAPVKLCTRCGAVRPKADFHADLRRPDGRHSWCKPCFHRHVASTRTPASEALRRARAYADPVRRARLQAKRRRWSKAHPEQNREQARRYQARKRAATVEKVDYGAILARDGMVCHLCRTPIAELADLHFDHVIPLARGGEHSMANIKPAHAVCNLRKRAKLVSELDWLPATAGAS